MSEGPKAVIYCPNCRCTPLSITFSDRLLCEVCNSYYEPPSIELIKVDGETGRVAQKFVKVNGRVVCCRPEMLEGRIHDTRKDAGEFISDILAHAKRYGEGVDGYDDIPEGSKFIVLSDTLARNMARWALFGRVDVQYTHSSSRPVRKPFNGIVVMDQTMWGIE